MPFSHHEFFSITQKNYKCKRLLSNKNISKIVDKFRQLLYNDKPLLFMMGRINPVREIIEQAHRKGVSVLVDGAQSVPHMPIDVQELQCDFFAFSGHKMYGPTGIGVLYGRAELLEKMPPYQGGGDMIRSVTFKKTTFSSLPYKFEAGTPNIAGAIGLAAAVDYLSHLGMENIAAHEKSLLEYATTRLLELEGLSIIGTAKHKAAVISFLFGDVHPHDIGTILDQEGTAVRTGPE